jgi:hypothetical protein
LGPGRLNALPSRSHARTHQRLASKNSTTNMQQRQ